MTDNRRMGQEIPEGDNRFRITRELHPGGFGRIFGGELIDSTGNTTPIILKQLNTPIGLSLIEGNEKAQEQLQSYISEGRSAVEVFNILVGLETQIFENYREQFHETMDRSLFVTFRSTDRGRIYDAMGRYSNENPQEGWKAISELVESMNSSWFVQLLSSIYKKSGDAFTDEYLFLELFNRHNVPHVPHFYGSSPENSKERYFIMQDVGGVNLADRIFEGHTFSPRQAITIAEQLLETVIAMHQPFPELGPGAAIVHEDIKSENIHIIEGREALSPEGLDIFLLDYGSGRLTREIGQAGFLDSVSRAYVAPEQLDKNSSTQSDSYSVGNILYEVFTHELRVYFLRRHGFNDLISPSEEDRLKNYLTSPQYLIDLEHDMKKEKIPDSIIEIILTSQNPDPTKRDSAQVMLAKLAKIKSTINP